MDKPYTTSTQQGEDIWTQTQLTMKIFELKLNSTGRYLDLNSTQQGDIWTQPQLNMEIFGQNLSLTTKGITSQK